MESKRDPTCIECRVILSDSEVNLLAPQLKKQNKKRKLLASGFVDCIEPDCEGVCDDFILDFKKCLDCAKVHCFTCKITIQPDDTIFGHYCEST